MLTAIKYLGKSKWLCKCDCGNETIVVGGRLNYGTTKSCGCLKREITSIVRKKHNTYDLSGEYGIVYTSKGEEFWFDKEDYDKVKDYYWRKDPHGYLRSQIFDPDTKKYIIFSFHRIVTDCPDDLVPDHINGKRFDNRKCNLRIATRCQNNMNMRLSRNNTSGVKGVNFDKRLQKWRSRINVNKKTIELGYFNKFEDAVKVRKEAEEKYFGQFSYDNSRKRDNDDLIFPTD